MSKILCDDYYMYKRIHEKGAKIAFITGQSSGARAKGTKLPPYENDDGFAIHRLYKNSMEMLLFSQRKIKEVLKIARELKPNLILCHLTDNMHLALMVQKYLKVPIVLHVEIAGNIPQRKLIGTYKILPMRRLIGMPFRGPDLWSWCCQKADALISSHPPDQSRLSQLSRHGKPVYYLPWPASIPEGVKSKSARDNRRGVYAGLLIPFKNTHQFEWVLPAILENTSTEEFLIIGAGTQTQMIEKLQQQFHDRIEYIPKLKTREELLDHISDSYYAFTPVKEGGWGFIGDCWGTGTPLLMLHNVFCSESLGPCIAKDKEDLVRKINLLYTDSEFYNQLREIGYAEFKKRTANAVGDELYNILSKTLKNRAS